MNRKEKLLELKEMLDAELVEFQRLINFIKENNLEKFLMTEDERREGSEDLRFNQLEGTLYKIMYAKQGIDEALENLRNPSEFLEMIEQSQNIIDDITGQMEMADLTREVDIEITKKLRLAHEMLNEAYGRIEALNG